MTIDHQDRYIGMEEHLPCNRGVKHPCEQRTAIGAQDNHVNLLITHELLNRQEEIAIG